MPATPLDLYIDLNAGAADRRVARHGLFFGESPEVVRRLVAGGVEPAHLMVSERRRAFLETLQPSPADVTVLSERELFDLVGFEMHRGVIGLFHRPPPTSFAVLGGFRRVAVIEGVNDHSNLGSIIRAGVGLGIAGVVLDPTTADPFARRSVRVSMGTVGSIPIAPAPDWPRSLEDLNVDRVVALAPSGSDRLGDVPRHGSIAILVGAEGSGLTEGALEKATYRCAIPMHNGLDSLNVSQAAAIAFHYFMPKADDDARDRSS